VTSQLLVPTTLTRLPVSRSVQHEQERETVMAAYVEHRFDKGFLLDEERLRKLVSIISQRLTKSEPPTPHNLRIFRADSYSYETENVQDVINEDNADWRRITKLEIHAKREKEFEFDLT
jgi:hypothetical protein